MVERVIDYLLVTTDPAVPGEELNGVSTAGSHGPIALTDQVRIDSIDEELAHRLMLACELRGERWEPARQYGVAQAFVREIDFTDDRCGNPYAWDEDQAIYVALALSRLIRPHATGCDYALRRIIDTDDRERLVSHDAEEARVAFRIDDRSRGWLDVGEAEQLRALLAVYDHAAMPSRIKRAMWLCELMVRERYLEDALPLIVAGLEALLKVGSGRLTDQFSQRTAALSAELSTGLDEARCEDAYDDRSGVVHGAQVDLSIPVHRTRWVSEVDGLQQTLRAAIRKAIEEPQFRALFASDAAIEARWPLRPR
jgi:hypothetical protein